ncbi:UNVERIFIED_CONTAM: hypothetical protein FKN15_016713 [Acipenser sinensis]
MSYLEKPQPTHQEDSQPGDEKVNFSYRQLQQSDPGFEYARSSLSCPSPLKVFLPVLNKSQASPHGYHSSHPEANDSEGVSEVSNELSSSTSIGDLDRCSTVGSAMIDSGRMRAGACHPRPSFTFVKECQFPSPRMFPGMKATDNLHSIPSYKTHCSIPSYKTYCSIPSYKTYCSIPSYKTYCSIPSYKTYCSIPSYKTYCSIPSYKTYCSIPSYKTYCSIPSYKTYCSIPSYKTYCSIPSYKTYCSIPSYKTYCSIPSYKTYCSIPSYKTYCSIPSYKTYCSIPSYKTYCSIPSYKTYQLIDIL